MRVDTDSLIKHFGFSIGKTESDVKSKHLRVNCPLHQDPDASLRVIEDKATGDTVYHCDNPCCAFNGDAVALVATARKVTLQKAIQMFRPGGEFSDCLEKPLGADEAAAYAESADTQSRIKAYLSKCKAALRRSPEKARVRAGMSIATLRLLHPDVGLFIPDDAPGCLSEFTKPKYNKSSLLLYPYTLNGDITRIEVRDSDDPLFCYTAVVTSPTAGVFGEQFDDVPKHFVVTEDPRVATIVFAGYSAMSRSSVPIVAASSFPLPGSMSGITKLRILSPLSNPVSVGFVLDAMMSSELVSGSSADARIFPYSGRVEEMTKDNVDSLLDCSNKAVDLQYWLVQRFVEMVKRGQSARVVSELEMANATPLVRNIILDQARKFDTGATATNGESEYVKGLVKLLEESPSFSVSANMKLANGMTLIRESVGLSVTGKYGGIDTLCNVGITVDSKTITSDGKDVFCCTVTHKDPGIPVIKVVIPEEKVSADRIQKLVSRTYMAKGCNPYVAFYSVKGASWLDVLSRLSEHCPVSKEVSSLGFDDLSEIQLPEVTVLSNGTARPQVKAATLPDNVLRAYGGIPFSDDESIDPVRHLFEACGNMYVMAFTLGFCHVLYQMTFGLFKPESARKREARHLFFVETEPGIWSAVFRQLSDLFSDNGLPPTVNCQNPAATFDAYRKLGTLPLIAYAPTLGNKFSSSLEESGVDMVGLVDTTTAVMANGKVSSVYVTPSDETPSTRCAIDGRDIDAIRKAFIPFLSRFVASAKIDAAFRAASSPCLSAYSECCRILGVAESDLSGSIAKTYFPGVGMNGVSIFFDMLHRSVIDDSKPSVCVIKGPPQKGYSFTRRGQHVFVMEDYVIVSHMVADIYNQYQKGMCRFDIEQLTSEMEATEILRPIPSELNLDPGRCWCIGRDVWEKNVVRPPINLKDPVMAGTIKLEKIVPTPT